MKATGIIRKIDDLGRIVVPKEIRKNLRIKDGEDIEIYIDENNNIVLKKYSLIKKINDIAPLITDTFYQIYKEEILITDEDYIISTTPNIKKLFLNKKINKELEKIIKNKIDKIDKNLEIVDNKITNYYAVSIVQNEGKAKGSIILLSENEISEQKFKQIKYISRLVSNYIDNL